MKQVTLEKEEVAKKLERSNRESWRESFDSLCSMVNKFCEHEERKAGKRIEAELQDSTPMGIENVEVVGCGEAIVVDDEFVVAESIKEVIDVPKSFTILNSNECDEDGVEASEDLPSNKDQLFGVEQEDDDSKLSLTNINKVCFVFYHFQSYEESIHEDAYVLFPPGQRMIYEDECVPRAIIPNLNKTRIRG